MHSSFSAHVPLCQLRSISTNKSKQQNLNWWTHSIFSRLDNELCRIPWGPTPLDTLCAQAHKVRTAREHEVIMVQIMMFTNTDMRDKYCSLCYEIDPIQSKYMKNHQRGAPAINLVLAANDWHRGILAWQCRSNDHVGVIGVMSLERLRDLLLFVTDIDSDSDTIFLIFLSSFSVVSSFLMPPAC